MVRAWYLDTNAQSNPRDENQRLPPKFVTLEDLQKLTGLECECSDDDSLFEKLKKERGYSHEDELATPIGEPDLKNFYTEHLHAEDEIRFVVGGCAYYDLRDRNDEWVRVEVMPGDLIVVPGGCYHRFTLDHSNFIKIRRLSLRDFGYDSYPRPKGDKMDCRRAYLKTIQVIGAVMDN